MAGYTLNAAIINQQLGDAVQRVRDGLETLVAIDQLAIDSATSGAGGSDALVSKYGMTAADAADLRAVASAFAAYSRVGHAQQTVPVANDFFYEARIRMILALQ